MTRTLRELRGPGYRCQMSRGHNCHLMSLIISHHPRHPLITDITNLWPQAPQVTGCWIYSVRGFCHHPQTENVQQSINQTRGNADNSEHFVSVVTTRTFRSIVTLWAHPTRHQPRPHNIGLRRGHQSHKRLKGSVYKDSALLEHEDNLYL